MIEMDALLELTNLTNGKKWLNMHKTDVKLVMAYAQII